MKVSTSIFIAAFLAIGVVFATPSLEENHERLRGVIDGLINKTLNNILANLSDPIEMEKLQLINSTSDELNGYFDLENFKLYGVKKLVATQLNVSVINLSLKGHLYVKQIVLGTKYDGDLTLLEMVPLYGSGHCSVTIDDINISIAGKVKTKGGVSISNLTVSFTIGDGVFQLTGLLDNEDFSVLVSTMLTDNVKPFINNNQEAISRIVSPIIDKLIQAIVGGGSNSTKLFEQEELYEAEVGDDNNNNLDFNEYY